MTSPCLGGHAPCTLVLGVCLEPQGCHVTKWHMGVLMSGVIQVSVVLLGLSKRKLENAVERN